MNIVTRAEWGARAPRSRSLVDWPAGVDLWVHHTAGPPTQSVKSIQDFHMGPSRNWSDIGYGYLCDEDGTLYEGRGFEVHAAHSPGKNHEPSVALIGTYTTLQPTDAQHASVCALMEFLDAGELRGHRENTGGTTCPGDGAMTKIVHGTCAGAHPDNSPRFFFEELPHNDGGNGPVIGGQAKGYAKKDVRDEKMAAYEAANPEAIVSTLRSGDDGTGDNDEARFYFLIWEPGTFGTRYRFGPWRSESTRDANKAKREHNTGRVMRPFNGRQRSLYPWAAI